MGKKTGGGGRRVASARGSASRGTTFNGVLNPTVVDYRAPSAKFTR